MKKNIRIKLKHALFFLSGLLFLTSCNSDDDSTFLPVDLIPDYNGKVYQISFFKVVQSGGINQINQFTEDISSLLDNYGGRLLSPPITITDSIIESNSLPSVARTIDYNFMLITEFPDEDQIQLFRNNLQYQQLVEALENNTIDSHTELLSIPSPPPPGGNAPPLFGSIPAREQPPAFYLLNFITLIDDPISQQSFNDYLGLQIPRVLEVETVFSNTFIPLIVLKGEFVPVTFISLAEFRDEDAFNQIHNDIDAIENIFPLRNNVISDFVEARATIN